MVTRELWFPLAAKSKALPKVGVATVARLKAAEWLSHWCLPLMAVEDSAECELPCSQALWECPPWNQQEKDCCASAPVVRASL